MKNANLIIRKDLEFSKMNIEHFFKKYNIQDKNYNYSAFEKFIFKNFKFSEKNFLWNDGDFENYYEFSEILNIFFIGSPYENLYYEFNKLLEN